MRVYIFGAGASKGAQIQDIVADRASPLMRELFEVPYRRFAREVGFREDDLAELKAEIGKEPIEEWLTKEWDHVEGVAPPADEEPRAQLGSQQRQTRRTRLGYFALYIWRLFLEVSMPPVDPAADVNRYRTFLRHLTGRAEEFALISFNYDALLDQAVADVVGDDLTSLESYQRAKLSKPHGSVNWLLERRGSDPGIDPVREEKPDYLARFRLAAGAMFGRDAGTNVDYIRVIPPGHAAMRRVDGVFRWVHNSHFYPLLMLPVLKKTGSPLHSWLPQLPVSWAHQMLSGANDIYVVGYRARDSIFTDMLHAVKKARLHVVGQAESAAEIAERVGHEHPELTRGTLYTDRFQGYVEAGCP